MRSLGEYHTENNLSQQKTFLGIYRQICICICICICLCLCCGGYKDNPEDWSSDPHLWQPSGLAWGEEDSLGSSTDTSYCRAFLFSSQITSHILCWSSRDSSLRRSSETLFNSSSFLLTPHIFFIFPLNFSDAVWRSFFTTSFDDCLCSGEFTKVT